MNNALRPAVAAPPVVEFAGKPCKACQSTVCHTHTATERMFGFGGSFTYQECANCGSLQLADIPEDLSRYYPDNYYSRPRNLSPKKRWLRLLKVNLAMAGLEHVDVIDWVKSLKLRRAARICDAGCGSGDRLYNLRLAGFANLIGIDPYIQSTRLHGVPLRQATLKQEVDSRPASYDLVFMNHSFEHTEDPLDTLVNVRKLLAPNGKVVIACPVIGYAWRRYKTNWVQLDPPRHLFIPSVQAFQLLARQAELTVDRVVYDSTEFQFLASELYLDNLPKLSGCRVKDHFTRRQCHEYLEEAEFLNRLGDGDQACFFLSY